MLFCVSLHLLGIEPITTNYDTVYNGITDDDTCIDNLYPTFELTRVNLLEVTADSCWHVVMSPHACFRVLPVLPCAPFLLVS